MNARSDARSDARSAPAPKAKAKPGPRQNKSLPGEVRIIGGIYKRTKLPVADKPGLRPTPDRVRETLFNWLGQDLTGWRCIDIFAGTGALGLEALSRGAAKAHFIERDQPALAALRANIARLRAVAVVHEGEATRPPRGVACGLVFLDPPYGQGLIETALASLGAAGWIAPGALVVAETERREDLAPWGEVLAERNHGMARITVLRAAW